MPLLAETLAEHQRSREQHRARICDALAGDVHRGPVARPEDAGPSPASLPQASRRRGSRHQPSSAIGTSKGKSERTTSKTPGSTRARG